MNKYRKDIMPNKLIEKIRSYLKEIDLESLQHKYQDQSTNDDFIQYEPLPESYLNNFDDSIIKNKGEV